MSNDPQSIGQLVTKIMFKLAKKLERSLDLNPSNEHKSPTENGGTIMGEYVTVETQTGEFLVGEIPSGGVIPNDIAPDQAPFTQEQAEQIADALNEAK